MVGPTIGGMMADRFGGFLTPSLAAATALFVAATLAYLRGPVSGGPDAKSLARSG